MFSIVYRSICLASLGFAAGDAEKTELKYPFPAAADPVEAGVGGDFLTSMLVVV